jgi:hypothetical protein
MSAPKPTHRAILVKVLLWALTFGLLAAVFWTSRDQIRDVFARRPDGRLFALGFVFCLVATVLTFVRWYLLVRALELPFTLRDAVRLGFLGLVFNMVIPGAVGGDVVKAAFLCREQTKKTQAIASMLIDRVVGLLGLFSLASIAGILAWSTVGPQVHRLIVLVWVVLAVGFAGLTTVFTPALFALVGRLVAGRRYLGPILAELHVMASAYRKRMGTLAAGLIMSVGIHSLCVLGFYAVSRALFPHVSSLAQHFLMFPLVLFTTAVPLPFGALGLSEEVSAQLFRLVHQPSGAVTMMAFRVLLLGVVGVGFAVYLFNQRQARRLAMMVPTLEEQPVLSPEA